MNLTALLSRAVAAAALGWVLLLPGAVAQAQAQAPSVVAASRGELLYATHCVACHSTQMHWRENKQAINWDTLKAQVRRWQGMARLEWTEADVEDVARYLNQTIYGYPEPARVGLLMAP